MIGVVLFSCFSILRAQYNSFTPLTVSITRGYLELDIDCDILVEIDKSNLVGSLEEFCEDIKFLDIDEKPIPYFLESGCNTTTENLQVWLRFNSTEILDKMSVNETFANVNLTLHYGNPLVFLDQNTGRQLLNGGFILLSSNKTTGCPSPFYRFAEEWNDLFFMSTTSDAMISVPYGKETHTHPYQYSTEATSPYNSHRVYCPGSNQASRPAIDHLHNIDAPSTTASNIPSHYDIKFCYSTPNRPIELYEGMIVFGNDIDTTTDLTRFSEADSYFFRNSENNVGSVTEPSSHVHEVASTTGAATTDYQYASKVWVTLYTIYNSHTHTFSIDLSSESPVPKYVTSRCYKSHKKTVFKKEMIFATNSSIIPYGYTKLNLLNRYIKNDDSYGVFDGTGLHSHSIDSYVVNETPGGYDVKTYSYSGAYAPHTCYVAKPSHKHTINTLNTIDDAEHLPPAIRVIFIERKKVNYSSMYSTEIRYNEASQLNWSCDGVPSTSSEACNEKGQCFKADSCFCEEEYFGSSCQEKICSAEYLDPNTIEIPFEIRISEIDKYGYQDAMMTTFNCSLIVSDLDYINLGKDSCECSWVSENLMLTKSLVIRNTKNSAIDKIKIKPISKPTRLVDVPVTLYTSPTVAGESGGGKGDQNVGTIVGVSVSVPLALGFFLFVAILLLICLACIPICCCLCLGSFLIFVLGVSLYSQRKRLKMFNEIEDIDLILKEQEHLGDKSIAHLQINKSLFVVDYKDIKITEKIGSGGSFSVVFKAQWKSRDVAFKCFRTTDFTSDEGQFEEFEREVSILASVSHPNILQFYGATLKPPRVGILMEYCDYGDLRVFISRYREENNECLPFKEKFRMTIEISSAMSYIHSQKIIHRDLKLDNILVTKNLITKLMDFGLSKLVARVKDSDNITKMVGTSYGMAPEVVAGSYGLPCDVFSFSILMFEFFTENFSPYGKKQFGVELKVANDPEFRPDLKTPEAIKSFKEAPFLKKLMKDCWSHNPEDRPTFEEILDRLFSFGEENDDLGLFDEEEKTKKISEQKKSNGRKKGGGGGIVQQFGVSSVAYDFERVRKENIALRKLVILLKKNLEEERGSSNNQKNVKHDVLFERKKKTAPLPPFLGGEKKKVVEKPTSKKEEIKEEEEEEYEMEDSTSSSSSSSSSEEEKEEKEKRSRTNSRPPPPPIPVHRMNSIKIKKAPPPIPTKHHDAKKKKASPPPPIPSKNRPKKKKAPPPPVPSKDRPKIK